MQVQIKEPYKDAAYCLDLDYGTFRCLHINAEVESPCCSGRDELGNPSCACHGQYGVYCYDCNNDDLEDYQVEDIINQHIGGDYED